MAHFSGLKARIVRNWAAGTVAAAALLGATVNGDAPAAHAVGLRAAPPACGGPAPIAPSRVRWVCSFDDEFDASTNDATALDRSKWTVQQTSLSAFHSGSECFVDSVNNVSVSGGHLNLTVRKEPTPFTCKVPRGGGYQTQYTSGDVFTGGHFYQTYGRVEVRAKLPAVAVRGLQESFWLWPVDAVKYGPTWPQSGEIDIAEIYHQYADRAIPYIHYVYSASTVNPKTNTNIPTNTSCLIKDISTFHTYVVEWTPAALTIIYDGRTCLIDNWVPAGVQHPAPFDQPFFIALTQALGIGTNAFDPAVTPLPATTQVDYVRVWAFATS